MTPVLNRDLYERQCGGDQLYVVADPPKMIQHQMPGHQISGNQFNLRINLDKTAAVLDKHADAYPYNHRVSEIRKGKAGLWLLSGGTVITDHKGHIAVGLRDGNAADPFAFTNIGAGRCDRMLTDHCKEEFESEFILCVQMKPNADWVQIRFGPATPELANVRQRIPAIAKWKTDIVAHQLIEAGGLAEMGGLDGPDKVTVEWYDERGVQGEEKLSGYVLEDGPNNTIEFRMPVKIDLSPYHAEQIFFAEGTGYALWKSPEEIRALEEFAAMWGIRLVTPFLENVTGRI